jgi:chromosomal replication initiator protein
MILDNKFLDHLQKKFGFDLDNELELYLEENRCRALDAHGIFKQYLSEISMASGIPEEVILGKNRKREHTLARHMTIWLCRNNNLATLKTVGQWFGGLDHSSVLHAIRVIENMFETKHQPALILKEQIKHFII